MKAIAVSNKNKPGLFSLPILLLALLFCSTAIPAEVSRLPRLTAMRVDSVTPDRLTQGQSATLTLRGVGLQAGMRLDLGEGIDSGVLAMVNDTTARVDLRVRPDAAPGSRSLTLLMGRARYTQRATITILARAVRAPSTTTLTPSESPQGFAPSSQAVTAQETAAATLHLLRVTPDRLQRGRAYTLNLAGAGFAAGMSVDFGDGIRLRGPVLVQNGGSASARIEVTTDAAPGFRSVTITLAGTASPTAIAAVPSPGQQTQQARALEIIGPVAVLPGTAIEGTRTPPAAGGGFAPPSVGSGFAPPVAPPSPATPPTDRASPQVTRIRPDHLVAGRRYNLTLEGEHLNSSLNLDFGEDIDLVGRPLARGEQRLNVTVKLDKQAKPGIRKLRLGQKIGTTRLEQSAQFTVAPAPVMKVGKPRLVTPKLPQFDTARLLKGRIDLQSPDWRQQVASQAPMKDPVTGKPMGPPTPIYEVDIPLLNDDLMFSWNESNPGTSEWFEIRFYAKGKLIAKRRIDPITMKLVGKSVPVLPTWFRPDGKLISELLQQVAAPAQSSQQQAQSGLSGQVSVTTGQTSVSQQAVGVAGTLSSSSDPALALANAKLLWEVAGYRKYHKSGVVKHALADLPLHQLAAFAPSEAQTVTDAQTTSPVVGFTETEVAISERWPLKRPASPTGLGCGSESGNLTLVNLDKAGKQQGGALTMEAGDGHVGDRFRLTGSFKLDASPYASHPQTQQSTYNPPLGGSPKVFATTWNFDNLFVDWGDGTLTPFSMTRLGDAGSFSSGDTLSLGEKGRQHSYSGTGPYTVRLYQLAASDVQGGGQQVASLAVDDSQNLYAKVSQLTPGASAGQAQQKWSKSVADRAYMLFCRNVRIEPRSDPASHGPLQLVSIGIDNFAGQNNGAQHTALSKPGTQRKSQAKELSPTTGSQAGNLSRAKPGLHLTDEALPTYSSCDAELTAEAAIGYIGQGKARLRWRMDGIAIGEDEIHLGPSKPRSQQDLAKLAGKKSWYDLSPVAPPIVDHAAGLPSPPIGLSDIGKHSLQVDAEVIPEAKSSGLYGMVSAAFGANGMKADPAVAKQLAKSLKHAPKIGVLSPGKVSQAGLPAVSYLNEPLQQVAGEPAPIRVAALSLNLGTSVTLSDATLSLASELAPKKGPPSYVVSDDFGFKVAGADKAQACSFDFPVPGGVFKVAGLQSPGGPAKVTHHGSLYEGTGTLLVKLQSGGGAVKQWPVPISFKKWQLKPDGVTVDVGEFTIEQTGLTDLPLPALKASVARLQGKAGVGVDAWLNARLTHPELLEIQSGKPPAWHNVKGGLSADGDWYAADLPMAETQLYLGGFRIDPNKIALDLSTQQGAANGECESGSGDQFVGVALGGSSKLSAYDFGLTGTPNTHVDGWGIDAGGVCGKADLGAFQADLQKGSIAWDGISVTAGAGKLGARYHNLRVHVPWIEAELKGQGNPLFSAGQGAGTSSITLALKGQTAPVKNGPITLEATNLALTRLAGVGWAVSSDTRFDFAGADKQFARDVWLDGLLFGLDGRAYLPNGPQAGTLTDTSGFIAQGPVTLKSLQVSAPDQGPQRLQFDFLADLQLSKSLQAANMPVSYRISESNGSYQGSGPVLGSVPVTFAFPKTDTVTKGVIHPEYVGGNLGSTASAEPPPPLSWVTTADALSKQVIYRGTTDMDFLKSVQLPVSGQFELGYYGNDDYWAAVIDYQIPPPGLTVVPNLLSLYGLGGGLGYNVEKGSLSNNLASVVPKITGNNVYGANMTLGSAFDGGFAYTLKGYFNIDPSDPGLKMDFGLWLLSKNHGGTPKITGSLAYGSGIFHAEMGGKQDFAGGLGTVEANPGALQAHFDDSGDWYLKAGTKENPVTGKMLVFLKDGVWLNLGRDEGLIVGASVDAKLPDISCETGDVCATVMGEVVAEAQVTPQPHISSDSNANVSAKGCLGGCISMSLGAKVHAAGPTPPELGFGFGLNGCPIGKLSVDLQLLPAIDPGVSGGLCSPYETGKAVVEGAEKLMEGIGNAAEGTWNAVKSCFGFC